MSDGVKDFVMALLGFVKAKTVKKHVAEII
jgi:hypothetical protein